MPRLKSPVVPVKFAGVASPNTTQVPDQYLNELLPILSGAELKVLLYITRRTFGFKKATDNISLSQMLQGIQTRDGRQLDAGVGLSKKTLLQAIRSLEDQNIILTERRRSAEKGDERTSYRLHIRNQPSARQSVPPVGEKLQHGGGVKTPPGPWGKNSPTQHTVKQQTDFDLSNSSNEEDLADEDDDRQKSQHQRSDNFQQASIENANGATPLKALIAKRAPKRGSTPEDQLAVGAAIERLAIELNDSAPTKSSVSRAMNLYRVSGMSRDRFIDLLFLTKGEVQDRRHNPGKAPVPRNLARPT